MSDSYLLRSLTSAHRGPVHELLCVPDVYRYLVDGAPPSLSLTEDWISSVTESGKPPEGLWGLYQGGASRLLGMTRLSDFSDGAIEISYLLHPDFWGRGLATRMAHTLIGVAFSHAAVELVKAGTDEPNKASVHVMERLGMTFFQEVTYPAGKGLEYSLRRRDFDKTAIERIVIA